jgi:hypothetical protein
MDETRLAPPKTGFFVRVSVASNFAVLAEAAKERQKMEGFKPALGAIAKFRQGLGGGVALTPHSAPFRLNRWAYRPVARRFVTSLAAARDRCGWRLTILSDRQKSKQTWAQISAKVHCRTRVHFR